MVVFIHTYWVSLTHIFLPWLAQIQFGKHSCYTPGSFTNQEDMKWNNRVDSNGNKRVWVGSNMKSWTSKFNLSDYKYETIMNRNRKSWQEILFGCVEKSPYFRCVELEDMPTYPDRNIYHGQYIQKCALA